MDGIYKTSVDKINELALGEKIESYEELLDAFRHLRSICSKGSSAQNEIISDRVILVSTFKILYDILQRSPRNDEENLCLQIGLQFIGNLLVGNSEIQEIVWYSYRNLLPYCLGLNAKIQNSASLILYNILLSHPDYIPEFEVIYGNIIREMLNENSSEFFLYLLQLYISKTQFVQNVYNTLESAAKLIIIDVIQDLVKNSDSAMDKELISFFSDKFVDYSNNILATAETSESSFEAIEVVRILDLLISFSTSNESNVKELQQRCYLLEHCVEFLKCIHKISMNPNNNFCKITKISDLNEIEKNTDVQEHPSFGFKSSLIRLIGNLTWKNLKNQNIIRECDCIPILLDCCNIDGRNPFITQWAILAIRNICENNLENQKYIAALPKKGTTDVEQLTKMGILLNKNDDGSLVSICPLKFEEK